MLFTRTWIILLSLAAAAALGMALIIPAPASREVTRMAVANLDRAQHNAEMMLRLEARDWIDTAAKMARDRVVVDTLLQATDGTGVSSAHQATLHGRLLDLVSLLSTEARPKLVIAVDVNGKQVYRMGIGENTYAPGKDGLLGYPLVEEALRGGRRDDTWNIDGNLYLMAASPVISRVKGRYVGALLLGESVDDAFARRFKLLLGGTELSIFLNGKAVASTDKVVDVTGLPKLLAEPKHKKALTEKGRTSTVLVGTGATAYYAILTPIPGEAGVQGAFYALSKRPPVPAALPDLLGRTTDKDRAWGVFPWPLVLGALLGAMVVGLLLSMWEVSMPLKRMDKELARIKRGESTQLDPRTFGGRYGQVAAAINAALAKRAGAQATASAAATPVSTATAPVAEIEQATAPAKSKKKGGFMPAGMDPEELATEISKLPPEMANADPYDTVLDPRPKADLPGVTDKPAYEDDATGATDQKQAEVVVAASTASAPVSDGMDEEEAIAKRATVMSSIPETLAQADARDEAKAEAEAETKAEPEVEPEEEAEPEAKPEAKPEEKAPELDEYIRKVYEEFVEMKSQCGEDTSKLTLERFGTKLSRNRANLIKRFGCKTVKFQVYVKDGKAALKATPIKN